MRARALAPLCLVLAIALARLAAAAATPPHIFYGDPHADTVEATPAEVYPAAVLAFTEDDWQMAPETKGAHVVTQWREMHHPLLRYLMGTVWARCAVEIRPIDDHHTEVRFRGALASPNDIQSNPAFGLALLAYKQAVHDYYRDMHTHIRDEQKAAAALADSASGAPRAH